MTAMLTSPSSVLQKGQAAKLVPAEPGLLAEASRWVDSWQEPTGPTNYDAALQMAERYLEADCEYIFSDGLSDYAVVLLEVGHAMLTMHDRGLSDVLQTGIGAHHRGLR